MVTPYISVINFYANSVSLAILMTTALIWILRAESIFGVRNMASARMAYIITNIIHQESESIDISVLKALGIYSTDKISADERVLTAIEELEKAEAITSDMTSELCAKTYLSQSLLSHLFRQEIGISFGSYLAFMKIKRLTNIQQMAKI